MALNRSLGLFMLTLYGTGMILGAGIYSIIGQAAGIAGYALWQGFILAAFAALLTALSYAELASMFPKAGGEYVYLRNAFPKHRWAAGTVGNIMVFAGSTTAATVSLAFASYLNNFVHAPNFWVATGILFLFTTINIFGIQQSSWVNVVFTLVETIGLALFIWIGWRNPNFGNGILVVPNLAILSSAALIIFAYFGFENIVNLAEETKTPENTIPRAIFLSLFISTALYILVSIAAVALMPPDQLALTQSALTSASKSTAPRIATILGVIALFSTANTALIALLTTSRVLYGVSRDNSIPKVFSKTSKSRKTPWVAALAALAIAEFFLPLANVKILASIASFTTMIAFIAVNIALISLRITNPKAARSFKIPFAFRSIPILPVLAIVICVVFLFQFDRQIYLIGVAAFLGSAGLFSFYTNIKKIRQEWCNWCTSRIYFNRILRWPSFKYRHYRRIGKKK